MRFVDLFAGTGGIRLGFEWACSEQDIKTECVYSCEIDQKACESYELNYEVNPKSDIRDLEVLPQFDFLLAGFPCQAFSYAGKQKGFGDTRGTLFFEVERLLKLYKPSFFLLENVRGLTTHDQGRTFETITTHLIDLGYSVHHLLLNSSNFGVPQNRVRIYILGSRWGSIKTNLYSDPGPADSHKYDANHIQGNLFEQPQKTVLVRDILETDVHQRYYCTEAFVKKLKKVVGNDLSVLHGYRLIDYRGGQSIHSWELGLKGECTRKEIAFMNLLIANRRKKQFGIHQDGKALTVDQIKTFYNNEDLPELLCSLESKGYISCYDGKYNPVAGNMSFEVFKFLDPNRISITLTASDANRLGVVHHGIARRLTPRECARLQGYPDSYQLISDENAVYMQMGNGVSVPVIKAVIEDFFVNNYAHLIKAKQSNLWMNDPATSDVAG
ncbi:DNA (cytosine-5-)-methyltransferase [Spirulina sp. CCNP1310]|uniref:DNA (cytosine-5-)-methyltransferase n=1 Tax=Spirulina sp. CCNP1310 TaxID=3110249 RepID=UPI002B1EEBBB|nr:DNA (cytosine-5-)-methyltransferase [Spirulina sp. CCNP1310]